MATNGVFNSSASSPNSKKVDSLTVLRDLEIQGQFVNNGTDSSLFATMRTMKVTSQSIVNGAPAATLINWDNVVQDVGGCFNASTGVFTAPVTGWYLAGYRVVWTPNNAGTRTTQFFGTGVVANSPGGVSVLPVISLPLNLVSTFNLSTELFFLQRGETLAVQAAQSSGVDLNIISANFWVRFEARTSVAV